MDRTIQAVRTARRSLELKPRAEADKAVRSLALGLRGRQDPASKTLLGYAARALVDVKKSSSEEDVVMRAAEWVRASNRQQDPYVRRGMSYLGSIVLSLDVREPAPSRP